jgi:hypothetical protein
LASIIPLAIVQTISVFVYSDFENIVDVTFDDYCPMSKQEPTKTKLENKNPPKLNWKTRTHQS